MGGGAGNPNPAAHEGWCDSCPPCRNLASRWLLGRLAADLSLLSSASVMLLDRVRANPALHQSLRNLRMSLVRRRFGLKHVHPTFYLCSGSRVAPDLVAGAFSFVNTGCWVYPGVELGRYALLAPNVSIMGQDHASLAGTPLIFAGSPPARRTIIEDDVWLGTGAIVMTGLRIGRGTIVAAGSVVTKDLPPYAIAAGVPAVPIRERFPEPGDREKHDAMLREPPPRFGVYAPPLGQREFDDSPPRG